MSKPLEKLVTEARTDLEIARATVKVHVRNAAKFTALAETFPDIDAAARRGGFSLTDCKSNAAEAKRHALRWQRKADHLQDWLRRHPFVECEDVS